jgi:hypothetical protein
MERRNMPVPDGFFAARVGRDALDGQINFDQSFGVGHLCSGNSIVGRGLDQQDFSACYYPGLRKSGQTVLFTKAPSAHRQKHTKTTVPAQTIRAS